MTNVGRTRPLTLAFLLATSLAAFPLIPWVRANGRLSNSIWVAAVGLLLFLLVLRARTVRSGRVLSYKFLPRPVHYVQLTMHSSIYLYWGWYWREVYHYAPLIAAQIVFVYALDMLVCWSRRDQWILGFGPIPIVLSTNLFLWFKDDWFFLQFLLISTGVLCKEFITWKRAGRRTHIFNPSAIALAVFSLGLLATHSTQITWGEEVAVSLGRPPHIYLWIFGVGLVVQALFSVTLVTLCAAAMLFLLNLVYTGLTGVYYFVDATIPIAVFLGLHLLVTDPATSPRSNTAKMLFGTIYGAAVFVLYAVLGWFGLPTFYDKLLCVPPLNLLVPALDRIGEAIEKRIAGWKGGIADWIWGWRPRQANFAHMAIWMLVFAAMTGAGLIGGHHPGAALTFWNKACDEGLRNGCETWIHALTVACAHGSGKACYSLGMALDSGHGVLRNAAEAGKDFGRACDLQTPGACASLIALAQRDRGDAFRAACQSKDGESCFVLASLYHAGGGVPKDYAVSAALFRQSCDAGWLRGCGGLGELYRAGQGIVADPSRAIGYFEKACRGGVAASCFSVASLYRATNQEGLARQKVREACEISRRAMINNRAYFRAGNSPEAAMEPELCVQQTP